MGFNQSKAESDVWMRINNDIYEYLSVYVNEIIIESKQPNEIISKLTYVYYLKLKGKRSLSYHIGMDL